MNLSARSMVAIGVAFCVGVIACLAFGPSPGGVVPTPPAKVEWHPADTGAPDLAGADANWEAHTPWGAPPKPVETVAPPPAPPMPVGVARGERGLVAIFMRGGKDEMRVAPGDPLPDGGRVLEISGLRVTWVDGAGVQHEREIFAPVVTGTR